jgi:hypothetical protein
MLTATLQESTPTSTSGYRCAYIYSSDGLRHLTGSCPGGPGTAFVDQRDALKRMLAAGEICYFKVRDNRSRTAEAGVCKGDDFDKVLDTTVQTAEPVEGSWWDRHGREVLIVGGGSAALLGAVLLAGYVQERREIRSYVQRKHARTTARFPSWSY